MTQLSLSATLTLLAWTLHVFMPSSLTNFRPMYKVVALESMIGFQGRTPISAAYIGRRTEPCHRSCRRTIRRICPYPLHRHLLSPNPESTPRPTPTRHPPTLWP